MFCNRCGAQVPDNSEFCPNCGNRMQPEAPAAPYGAAASVNTGYYDPAAGPADPNMAYNPAQGYVAPAAAYAAPKPAKKKGGKIALLICGILVVVAAAAVAAFLLLGKPYAKPVEKMFSALNTNNASLLSECATGNAYTDLTKVINWSSGGGLVCSDYSYDITSASKLEGSALSQAQSEFGGSNFYNVQLSVRYYDPYRGESMNETIPVIVGKVGGKWKVCDSGAVGLPYVVSIATLFSAYNNNDLSLLAEAVSPTLYDNWYHEAITDHVNDDSFIVDSIEKMDGDDLLDAQADYGVTDCYTVVIDDSIYVETDGTYNKYTEYFVVGRLDGEWKIVDIY